MIEDTVPNDDHRGMARRAGYEVLEDWQYLGVGRGYGHVYFVRYMGPDRSRRALRDIGPFDTEDSAWARAVGLAMEYRDGE